MCSSLRLQVITKSDKLLMVPHAWDTMSNHALFYLIYIFLKNEFAVKFFQLSAQYNIITI